MRQLACALAGVFFVATSGAPSASAESIPVGEKDLSHRLTEVVSSINLEKAKLGISVVDVDSGQTLFSRNDEQLLSPASCIKLFTSAAALRELGPHYTFRTRLVASKAPTSDGTIHGDLYVIGEGDPTLNLQNVWRVADMVRRAGVKRIKGDIVVDASAFDDHAYAPGMERFSENRAYTAPTGAVSVNWNTVAFVIRPGAKVGDPVHVVLDPPTKFIAWTNTAKTIKPGTKRTLAVTETKPGQFVVEGELPINRREKAYYRAIHDASAFAATIFKEYITQTGVVIEGKTRKGRAPLNGKEIAYWDSPPLSFIVRLLNKHSNNFIAEQLTKKMGSTHGPGSTDNGLEVIRGELAEIGLKRGTYKMLNGSGLNRENRVSPKQMTHLLSAAWNDFSIRPEYVSSLPIAGADGTIGFRMRSTAAKGQLRAKTGTLRGTSCLAGYTGARNGRVLAFSILVNDVDGSLARAVALQDRIGAILAGWSDGLSPPAESPKIKKAEARPQEK